MKSEPTKVKCELRVVATTEASLKAQEDLEIEDPDIEKAKAILKKAIAEGTGHGQGKPETAETSRTPDSEDSQSEKKE